MPRNKKTCFDLPETTETKGGSGVICYQGCLRPGENDPGLVQASIGSWSSLECDGVELRGGQDLSDRIRHTLDSTETPKGSPTWWKACPEATLALAGLFWSLVVENGLCQKVADAIFHQGCKAGRAELRRELKGLLEGDPL